jgi:hypothetical protein
MLSAYFEHAELSIATAMVVYMGLHLDRIYSAKN